MTSPVQITAAAPPASRAPALLDRFADRAGKLGVEVHRVARLDEVVALVARLAGGGAAGERRVVVAPGLDGRQPALRQGLAARGVAVAAVESAEPAATFAGVAVGVSEALLGVAETGSLLVADPFPDRLVRMLSPRHVVLLDAGAFVPGLDEAGERLGALMAGGGDARAAYASFITGPSRTADIEMSLTVGAHGPAELHVAVLGAARA